MHKQTRSIRLLGAIIFVTAVVVAAQGVFEKRVSPVAANETQAFQKHVNVALVVGISRYPEASGLHPLQFAAADANDVGALLTQQGYKVRVLTDIDATSGAIEQTIQELGEMVDAPQGTFLFYFSGHGFSVEGKNYLVPVGASLNRIDREGLAIGDVEQLMAQSKSKRQIMLLDACRSDSSAGQKGAGGRSFSAFQAAEGLRILNSTQPGKVSYESPELRHGVFTEFVLKGLQGAAAGQDGLVTFFDLAGYVTNAVRDWSFDHHVSQIPFDRTGLKEATGDFLLAAAKAGSPAPVPRPNAPSVPVGTREPGHISVNSRDGQRYVWIPPGSFIMGCSPGDYECNDNEKPAHNVSITRGFWLGQTPVTQSAFNRVMGTNPSRFRGDDLPAERVTWDEARRYCEVVGGRLPTEAEWEYAARAGTASSRYGDLNSIAWYSGNSGSTTHSVGTKLGNSWNLYDMLGNVWQWTADLYGEKYYAQQENTDPQGPTYGERRMQRGGSFGNNPWEVRVSFRLGNPPTDRNKVYGFRCVAE